MNREIKFRGFSFPEKRFVFGNYVKSGYNHFIVYDATEDDYKYAFDNVFIPCDENTISQFTGLTDNINKDIYEGDILLFEKNGNKTYSIVDFSGGVFITKRKHPNGISDEINPLHFNTHHVIIGNIHENPELLS